MRGDCFSLTDAVCSGKRRAAALAYKDEVSAHAAPV